MQWVKKSWHKTRKVLEKNFLVSVLVLLLLQVLIQVLPQVRFDKIDINWSSIFSIAQFSLLVFQCVIFCRQTQIMRNQAATSKKANDLLSEQTKMNLTSQRYAHYIEKLHRWISLLVKIEHEAEKIIFNNPNSKTNGSLFYEEKPIKESLIELYEQLGIEYPSTAALFSEKQEEEIKKLYSEMRSKTLDMINFKRIESGEKGILILSKDKTIEKEADELRQAISKALPFYKDLYRDYSHFKQ